MFFIAPPVGFGAVVSDEQVGQFLGLGVRLPVSDLGDGVHVA